MRRILLLLTLIMLINCVTVCAECPLLQNAAISAPGTSQSDWSAIAQTVSGNSFDKEAYISSLNSYVQEKYLTENKLSANKATEWHRIAIAVNLLGYDATNFYGINLINDGVYYRDNIGKQGLNGYIWALIAISSGNFPEPDDALNTKDSIISTILSSQNADGSFSLNGNEPNCDITAMAVYALSFYTSNSNVSLAIDDALTFLLSIQNADGTFSNEGVPNAESTAQVIIALAATGADIFTDTRFPNLYEALKSFETAEGFSHVSGGGADVIATYQSYCAIAAAERKSAIYSCYNHAETTLEQPTEAKTEEVSLPKRSSSEKEEVTEAAMHADALESQTKIVTEVETEAALPTGITTKASPSENNYFYLYLVIISFVFIALYVIIRRQK